MLDLYEDEFYYEPSEFEQQVDDFKKSLMQSVKEEFLQRMEALEKENASLREFRDQKHKLVSEYEAQLWEARREAKDAEEKWKNARLHQLLGEFLTEGWKVGLEYQFRPKCDKCDDDRKIHFLSPQGNPCKEACQCAARKLFYFPKEAVLSRMNVRKKDFGSGVRWDYINRYYTVTSEPRSEYDTYEVASDVYEDDFECEKVENKHRAVFLSKESCQRYCDWLNRGTDDGTNNHG